jgi:hypothetical protein
MLVTFATRHRDVDARASDRRGAALPAKLALMFSARCIWLNYSCPFFARDAHTLLRLLFVGPWLLIPFGVVGFVLAARPRGDGTTRRGCRSYRCTRQDVAEGAAHFGVSFNSWLVGGVFAVTAEPPLSVNT